MSTEDKKIVPFPGEDGNEGKNDRQKRTDSRIRRTAQRIRKHLGLSVLAGVIVPVIIAVVGPSLSKNFGETRLTGSYIMPYSYATDDYVANVRESDIKARMYSPRAEDMDADFYEKACAVRSFFSSSMVSKAQVTDSVLNIHELEEYAYADLDYFAFAKTTENGIEVRVYIVNSGNGVSEPDTLTFSGELVSGEDFRSAEDFAWSKIDSEAVENAGGTRYAVNTEGVCAGDGMQAYKFILSDWAMEELRKGKKILLYADSASRTENQGITLGWLRMTDGEVKVEGGGAGDGDGQYTYYVYVNVPADSGHQISVNAAFSIQDRASADTVIIPSESCRIRYSMTYRVDGKDLETEEFSTTIRVPLYKFFASYSIASHMNEEDIAHYVYRSDPELHEAAAFEPLSLTEDK